MIKKIIIICSLFISSSCALIFNDNRAILSVKSEPSGADVLIEGRSYGRTPLKVDIKPGRYNVSLIKEGFGSASFTTDLVQGIEEGPDGGKCMLDAIGSIFVITFYSAFLSEKCTVFKEDYEIKIPFTASRNQNGNSRFYPTGTQNNNGVKGYGNYNRRKNTRKELESYNENDLFIRRGYGRSPRLPVFNGD